MGNYFSSEDEQKLSELQRKIGYHFKNRQVFIEALTHDSLRVSDHSLKTYQRLEFLGDSVLQMIVSEHFFQVCPHKTPGFLTDQRTQYVSNSNLNNVARKLDLEQYIKLAPGVRLQRAGYQISGYGSFVESILGAIYVDAGLGAGGYTQAKNFVMRLFELPS